MKNRIAIILCIVVMLGIIFVSFNEVIKDYMPNLFEYYEIKKECPGKSKICSEYSTKESLEKYLEEQDPKRKFDTITLASYVVETSQSFGVIVYLSPLIMILLVVFKIHSEINCGFIENILTRKKYKNLLKKYILESAKVACLIPIMYLIILLISCLITGFNFEPFDQTMLLSPEIDSFKYNHFISYCLLLVSMQYLLHFGYALIGVFISFKSKSKIICIVLGYIYFVVMCLLYLIFGAYVVRNIFGFNYNTTNYFNLIGNYWFFNDLSKPWISYVVIISVIVINLLIIYFYIGKKEKAIYQYEKQVT